MLKPSCVFCVHHATMLKPSCVFCVHHATMLKPSWHVLCTPCNHVKAVLCVLCTPCNHVKAVLCVLCTPCNHVKAVMCVLCTPCNHVEAVMRVLCTPCNHAPCHLTSCKTTHMMERELTQTLWILHWLSHTGDTVTGNAVWRKEWMWSDFSGVKILWITVILNIVIPFLLTIWSSLKKWHMYMWTRLKRLVYCSHDIFTDWMWNESAQVGPEEDEVWSPQFSQRCLHGP